MDIEALSACICSSALLIADLHRNINSTTRGNPLKFCTYRPKYDLCKYNFTVRVINLWNSLPTHVVTALSVDSFKNRLDWQVLG